MNGNIPYDAYIKSVAADRTWLDASVLFVLAVHYSVDICIWQEDQDLRGWGPFVDLARSLTVCIGRSSGRKGHDGSVQGGSMCCHGFFHDRRSFGFPCKAWF